MGDFKVLNAEQKELAKSIGIEPQGYVVILDNERMLCMLHLKSRNEVVITKNRSLKQW